ncbi:TPA: phage major capsid protein [Streptococcus pyogenes]
MGTETSKASLFDKHLVSDLINKVKGHSSLAKLSSQKPIPFNGFKEFTFTLDSDIDVVAENGKKTHGGLSLEPVTIVPIKVEYGARLSDEFLYATEEEKIDILKAFNEGFAKKLARGIDLMAMHGINPRTKKASDVIGTNHFDSKVTQVVKFTESEDADANIEAAVNLIQGAEGVVTGLAMDTEFSTALAKVTNGEMGPKMYPELAWGANPDSINGLKSSVNTTVGAGADEAESKDLVIIGDFESMFKWGYAKQIPMEIIKYGDPDNSGKDLKGYNQIYLRAEAYIGWGILDAKSFARVTKGEV